MKRFFSAVTTAAALLATSGVSFAQTSQADLDRAERLFQEGKQLMNDKRFEEGCPKLQESQRIDPATGTLLALALCHEGQGRLASAYKEFKQALPSAQAEKRRDREQLANNKMNEIAPRVPKLTVQVASSAASDAAFSVTLDGERLDRSSLNATILVDPGEHVVEAASPGKTAWRSTVTLGEREAKAVTVPSLGDETPVESTPPPGTTQPFPSKPVGIALAAVGGVALIAGSVVGINAINTNEEAKGKCNPDACDSPLGRKLNDDARSGATLSTILVIGGVVLAAGGVALIVLGPKSQTVTAKATPVVGPGFAGVAGVATF